MGRERRRAAAPGVVAALVLSLGTSTAATAQGAAGATCARELAWASAHVARNYAGFADKVTPATQRRYDAALAAARDSAARATSPARCDAVLRGWLRFFADGHLGLAPRATAGSGAGAAIDTSPAALRARFAGAPRRDVTEASARERLARLGDRRHALEGIWEAPAGAYRVAILRDDARAASPDRFTMTVLRADSAWWVPGQVKATFAPDSAPGRWRSVFLLRDHTPDTLSVRPVRNLLAVRGQPWRRTFPVVEGDLDATQVALLVRPTAFAVHEPAPRTLVVQFPNFADGRAIDSLWRVEGSRLREAERLVIDVRGNGGGSDANYRALLPLLYTGPYTTVGARILATDDNVAAWRALLADSARMAPAELAQLRLVTTRLERARGGWVEVGDATVRYGAVAEFPRRVDVVVDRGCASSCEQFLLAARESGKATLYGERSAGVLDYANVRSVPMPGGTFVLRLPTSRSRRLPAAPVDPDGIAPDVVVPPAEGDWIGWILAQPFAPRKR